VSATPRGKEAHLDAPTVWVGECKREAGFVSVSEGARASCRRCELRTPSKTLVFIGEWGATLRLSDPFRYMALRFSVAVMACSDPFRWLLAGEIALRWPATLL